MLLVILSAILITFLFGYFVGRLDWEKIFLQKKRSNFSFQLRRLVALVLFVILVFAAKIIHNADPLKFDNIEMVKFIIDGLVAIGLLYTILTFEYTVKKNNEDKRVLECQGSFDILSQWYLPPLCDYSRTIYIFEGTENFKILKQDPEKFDEFFNSRTAESFEIRDATNGIFNFFEIICTGIKEEVIDPNFVRRYFNNVFAAYYDDWLPHILIRRKESEDLFKEYTDFVESGRMNIFNQF